VRSCANCALLFAKEKYQEFAHVAGLLGTHFTHIEIFHPLDIKTNAETTRAIHQHLREILPGGVLAHEGYKQDQMVTKVLCTVDISNETRIKLAQALGAEVRMQTEIVYRAQFVRVLTSVLAPDLPLGALAGDFEAALGGAHQFMAIRLKGKPVIGPTPDTSLPLPEYEPPSGHDENIIVMHAHYHCPRCGRRAVRMKNWLPATADQKMFEREPWLTIVEAP
jgi:hypothetical protein